MNDRQIAEGEVAKDKNKHDEQIMVDVYHELLNSQRGDAENIKHGLKRLSGFFYNQNRNSNYMYRLSILISTIALILTFTNVFPMAKAYENINSPIILVLIGVFLLIIAAFFLTLVSLNNFKERLIMFGVSLLSFVGLVIIEFGLFAMLY